MIPKSHEKSTYRTAFDLAQQGGNSSLVASLLVKSHSGGDGRATYALATWYVYGVHYKVNPEKAVRLLKVAAKKNVREAIYDLAYSYEIGSGVKRSRPKAVALYIEAALLGDKGAVDEVVRCLFYGVGIQKNMNLAFLVRQLAQSDSKT